MMGYGGYGWIGMIITLIIMITLIVGIVIFVIWLVRRSNQRSELPVSESGRGQTAKEIVQSRYARGEINREEYQQLLADIKR